MVPRTGRPGGLIRLFETVIFDALALWPQYAPDYYALFFADPDGLKLYRAKVLEKNWTEGDVRDALRKSDEYRKTGGRP